MDAIKKMLPIITVAIMAFVGLTTLAELGATLVISEGSRRYIGPYIIFLYIIFFAVLTLLANLPVESIKGKITGVFTMYKSKRALVYYVALPLFALNIAIPAGQFYNPLASTGSAIADATGASEAGGLLGAVVGAAAGVTDAVAGAGAQAAGLGLGTDNTPAWIFIITSVISFIGVLFLTIVETLNKGNE